MSDPGRITSNSHKVRQWQARASCASNGHQWDKGVCGCCGQTSGRTVRLTIAADASPFAEQIRRFMPSSEEFVAAASMLADVSHHAAKSMERLAEAIVTEAQAPSPFERRDFR